ncbi:GH92 family glycosyl hydrolase [Chitinophagaceae bacterium LB-8]|uniref:GH92 family glycosyl hydrolase n=1 Tax=Paraflavisolibacter caeni TaxID=2982496 RepID=A0A9X2XPU4_9BACT|nr:GH92 family glycosyl hydrolase [Paraflavisolibacter caeni]MCU7552208.1 GH92 family glycosyl hydrolase [Paraflavisolibacter caeni]
MLLLNPLRLSRRCSLTLVLIMFIQCIGQAQRLPVDYVNPFIGASTSAMKAGDAAGLGKTFPGAATPFGLVQVSPNTITGGDNGSGYSHEHQTIEGFTFTQMSGVGWYGDLGNFLVMPSVGPLKTNAGREGGKAGYRSHYDKATEKASAGYYSAMLTDYHIKAEATAAPHSGMLRFTFPKDQQSRIQVDLARRVGGTSTEQMVEVVNDRTIRGWMKCTPDGGGWGNGDGHPNYTVYFYAELSKPLKKFGVWSADIPDGMRRKRENVTSDAYQELVANAKVLPGAKKMQGRHLGFYSEFATRDKEQVMIKTGISFVSMEGAQKNLQAEIKDFNFDAIHKKARQLWSKALEKVKVTGGTEEEKHVFYTALYHTMIDPRCYTDVDGRYVGGDNKVHQTDKFVKRTIFSGWDVFRSQFPLQNIINPAVVNDMVNSLVELADESGKQYLEQWEFLNAYSACMIGNPAVSVLVDAYNKGIRNFDVAKAYRVAKNSCEKFGNTKNGQSEGISLTLEYAYFEWCLSQLADSLHLASDAGLYLQRSQSYRNIFDTSIHWFRPKDKDGAWRPMPKEGILAMGFGSVECNPLQQGWFVPHDVDDLAGLLGGKQQTLLALNRFFELTPERMNWNDYYNHANEPVHLAPFMFNKLGAPYLTQYWVREICRRAYHNAVEGLVGNEDVGQMSAWYVLAASGLHPSCPGDNRFEIFSPVFDKVEIQTDAHYAKGKKFTIIAHHNSTTNRYIQSARLNGSPYNKCYIDFNSLVNGDVLELDMGPEPNKHWGNL